MCTEHNTGQFIRLKIKLECYKKNEIILRINICFICNPRRWHHGRQNSFIVDQCQVRNITIASQSRF